MVLGRTKIIRRYRKIADSREGTGDAGIFIWQGKKLRALRTKDVACVVLGVNGSCN